MKNTLYTIIATLFSLSLFAQNQVDILRYSQYQVGGTARSIGYGGAIGSLGADFSTLSVNPAGIGMYRKSVVSVSPTVYFSNVTARMDDNKATGFKDNFNLNSYGIVFSSNDRDKIGWKAFQFGIGVNRQNNFNNYINITNDNENNSQMNDYINQAKGQMTGNLNQYSTDLAYYNWLLDTIPGTNDYSSIIDNGGVHQELKKTVWGSVNEMTLNVGSSYNDIFYIGGSVGFPFIRYFEESEYSEMDLADTIDGFNKYTINDKLETSGNGVNFKFGIIVRPTGYLRFGLAFHSPTWYSMHDEWSAKMTRYYDDGTQSSKSNKPGLYDYNLTTPMKLNASMTFTIARKIILSADADYINYSSGRLDANDYDYFDENSEARDIYKPTVNLRAGAEVRLQPLSLRAGLQYYGNAYNDDINNNEKLVVSAGIGYRTGPVFIDLAYSYTVSNEDYYLYDPTIIDPTDLSLVSNRIVMTMGYKF